MSFRGRAGRFVVPGAIAVAVLAVAIVAWTLVPPDEGVRVEVVQSGLEHPWDLDFAADGRMVVTERAGRIRVFAGPTADAALLATTEVPDVRAELESGLMGVAVIGDAVFVCASRDPGGDGGEPWRVDLLRGTLADDGSIGSLEPIPIGPTIGGPRHQGCAVEADADHLWVSIGDGSAAGSANPSQDPTSSSGKVLRLSLDGSIPRDNPFGPESPVYTLGHRNPQGLAIRADGLIVEVEHGTDTNDESNILEAGANYGYPCLTGDGEPGPYPEACPGPIAATSPAWSSGSPTLATSAAAFLDGRAWGDWEDELIVTTLKETDLRRFEVSAQGAFQEAGVLLDGRYGRLRAAVIGPDGALYVSTSNGTDDRVLRITRDG